MPRSLNRSSNDACAESLAITFNDPVPAENEGAIAVVDRVLGTTNSGGKETAATSFTVRARNQIRNVLHEHVVFITST